MGVLFAQFSLTSLFFALSFLVFLGVLRPPKKCVPKWASSVCICPPKNLFLVTHSLTHSSFLLLLLAQREDGGGRGRAFIPKEEEEEEEALLRSVSRRKEREERGTFKKESRGEREKERGGGGSQDGKCFDGQSGDDAAVTHFLRKTGPYFHLHHLELNTIQYAF